VRSRETEKGGEKRRMNGLKNYLDFDFTIKQKAKREKVQGGQV
jgi:hypothetical protein